MLGGSLASCMDGSAEAWDAEPNASFGYPAVATTPGFATRMFAKSSHREKSFARDGDCDEIAECQKKLGIRGRSSSTLPDVDSTGLLTVTLPLSGKTAQAPPDEGASRANGTELNRTGTRSYLVMAASENVNVNL